MSRVQKGDYVPVFIGRRDALCKTSYLAPKRSIVRSFWDYVDVDTAVWVGLIGGVFLHCLILFAALLAPTEARADVGDLRAWGVGGKSQFTVGNSATTEVSGIIQYQNGSLVVATNCNAQSQLDWCFTKLNVFGSIDQTWGTSNSGSVIELSASQDLLMGVRAAPNDGWFAFGGCGGSACIIKYLASGSRDASFGTSGKLTLGGARVNDVELGVDGRVTYVAECYPTSIVHGCVGRLLANGNADLSFNAGQPRVIAFGAVAANSGYVLTSIALDPATEKTWVAGRCQENGVYEFCVARLNANGTPDTNYASNGWQRFSVAGVEDIATQILLRPDGYALLVGSCRTDAGNPFRYAFCAIQLLPWTAALDTAFGDGGKRFINPIANGQNRITSGTAFLQPDGALALFGECLGTTGPNRACMALVSGNGSDDKRLPSFRNTLGLDAQDVTPTTNVGAGALIREYTGTYYFTVFGSCGVNGVRTPCLARVEWAYPRGGACNMDIDGDGKVLATTDGLILARIAAGVRGDAVVAGALGAGATRGWERIQEFLSKDCGMAVAR